MKYKYNKNLDLFILHSKIVSGGGAEVNNDLY